MCIITPATPKDMPALLAMIRKLCAFHGDTCQMGLAEAQAQFIDGPLTGLIAHVAGRPAGYAALEPRWRPMNAGPLIDIAHLFVEEPLRGRGIGRMLIGAAQAHATATGACRLVIGTAPDNAAAAATYRAMGLAEITQMPGPRFEVSLPAGA